MNIFVASWFFPPATSSEGIVTYKLLRNSKNQYDVACSKSRQWDYKADMARRSEKNITVYTADTDNIDEWVEYSVRCFEKNYPLRRYSCIMTRSTPPESILVGERIRQKYPEVKWIASMADPVANNPYELKAYVDDCPTLSGHEKDALKSALTSTDEASLTPWGKYPQESIRLLCKLRRWENTAFAQADMVISPTARQLRYEAGARGWMPKYCVIPHSFDPEFYSKAEESANHGKRIVFSFIGYSDAQRSLVPLVKAVRYLRESNCPLLGSLEIRLVGNNPRSLQDMVLNYYLDDIIRFLPGVDYYESLRLMQESDWLIHVDAHFGFLQPGGSIFFAGKIADYMGAGKPIFAMTGKDSPADIITRMYGGVSVTSRETAEIALTLEKILYGEITGEIDENYRAAYAAPAVAAQFDERVLQMCGQAWSLCRTNWPAAGAAQNDKLVTVCVPSYNVERYLDRCLSTLVGHEMAPFIEVLVVDDGSKDHTSEIGRAYEQHYPGIVRLIQKENGGHGSTINRALAEAAGRYFMIVDGDDWLDSTQFARLLKQIQTEKFDADILSSNYHEVDMETALCTPWQQTAHVEFFKKYAFSEIDAENTYFTLASSMIKTDLLRRTNMPLQEHTFYVDVEYILFPVPYLKTVMFTDYFIYKYCRGNAEQSVYIPTMVKRYAHHERVMRRVLEYRQNVPMDAAQRRYYDAIIKRLLYTHYALFMVYPTGRADKLEGYRRGKEFDRFLVQTCPDLAGWIGAQMPMVRAARRCGFDYARTSKSFAAVLFRCRQRARSRIKGRLHGGLGRKLLYNRFTVSIGKSNFFRQGSGKKIKDRLLRAI